MPQAFSGSVLVVDDEALVCFLTAETLRELGLNVSVANNGERALSMLGEGLEVDVLLTDVSMPGMDGFELSRRVAAMRPDTRIVYMSAYTLPENLPGNAVSGATLIAKPFTTSKISALLAQFPELRGRKP